MIYFATPSTQAVRAAMWAGLLGMINTPAQANTQLLGVPWCADNGCFGGSYPGDQAWLSWLRSFSPEACAFAVAPDVVADAAATLRRSAPFLPAIRAMGYPAALAAQNGIEDLSIPWDAFDVLFLGGDTTWKLGQHARDVTRQAKNRGKWVHMGRVNSQRRLEYAAATGCDSADGTYLTFGPDENLPNVLSWLRKVNDQQTLWQAS